MDVDREAKDMLVAANSVLEAYDDGKPLFPRMVELKRAKDSLAKRMCATEQKETML